MYHHSDPACLSILPKISFLLLDVVNLQPVEVLSHFPFNHIRSYALEKTVNAFDDSRDDAFGLNESL